MLIGYQHSSCHFILDYLLYTFSSSFPLLLSTYIYVLCVFLDHPLSYVLWQKLKIYISKTGSCLFQKYPTQAAYKFTEWNENIFGSFHAPKKKIFKNCLRAMGLPIMCYGIPVQSLTYNALLRLFSICSAQVSFQYTPRNIFHFPYLISNILQRLCYKTDCKDWQIAYYYGQ